MDSARLPLNPLTRSILPAFSSSTIYQLTVPSELKFSPFIISINVGGLLLLSVKLLIKSINFCFLGDNIFTRKFLVSILQTIYNIVLHELGHGLGLGHYESNAPNGFQKSYKVDCTTADTSLQADSGVILRQIIEEQNLHDFRKGFSDAKQFSLSFYVKTSKTGTYVCELYDMRNTRHVSATYTVSDTNWNRYTITFPADTTGSFVAANIGGGLIVHWWLVAGTNYTSGSLGTTWGNTAANRAVGQLNFADSTSNIFYLTGCQLEVGSVATDFEHRSYGQELELCKRYFQVLVDSGNAESFGNATGYNSTTIHFVTPLRPEMRTVPTLDYTNGTDYYGAYQNNTVDYFNDWTVVSNSHSRAVDISAGGGVSITAGSSVLLRTTNAASKIRFSAEL